MDIRTFRSYCLSLPGVKESTPWPAEGDGCGKGVLCFAVADRWFGLLHIDGAGSCLLRCPPEKAEWLRGRHDGIRPGWHTDMKHWNCMCLNADVPDDMIFELVRLAYDTVSAGLSTTVPIKNAGREQAAEIAYLVMEAMNHECCMFFAGAEHTLDDFHRMMTRLVEDDNSQYSYRNTLVATDGNGHLAGICVTYDGGRLHNLRRAFVNAAREELGRDFSDMGDETQAGELYIDSIAVDRQFRGRGIATTLLEAAAIKALLMGLPAVGLLVDKGNPDAERLYLRAGFRYVNDALWGGHPMKHLLMEI